MSATIPNTKGDAVFAAAAGQTYSLEEVARIIGKSPALLYRRLTEKNSQYRLRFARREGRQWVFPRAEVDAAVHNGESLLVKLPPSIRLIEEEPETLTKEEDDMQSKLPPGVLKRGDVYYARKQILGKRINLPVGTKQDAAKVMHILQVYADAGVIPSKINIQNPTDLPVKTEIYVDKQLITKHLPPPKITFSKAADDLYEMKLKFLATGKKRFGDIERLKAKYGNKPLESFTWEDIEALKNERLKEVKPGTVQRDLDLMSSIFKRQIKKKLITENPVQQIDRLKFNDARDNILTEEQFEALLSATWIKDNRGYKTQERIKPHLQLALLIADFTGMRQGEILAMTWANLNEKDKQYLIPKTKNFEKRIVPIHDELFKVLKEIPRDTDHIISWRGKPVTSEIKHGFVKARTVVNLTESHFHDIRHRAVSRYVQMGFPVNIIMKATGHKTMSAFLRYANLRSSDVMMLVGGKVEPIRYVSYAMFMELYRRPISTPLKE